MRFIEEIKQDLIKRLEAALAMAKKKGTLSYEVLPAYVI